METIEMLINDLESEILKAKGAAFSRTDVVVNKANMLDILSRIRENYPIALKEAAGILISRDQILKDAHDHANMILSNAEVQANQMLDTNEILLRAKDAAAEMKKDAMEKSSKMDYDARALAFTMLSDIEKTITAMLSEIDDKKNKLLYN